LYRDYLQLGRIDYLYDKVGLYDALKPVMQGNANTDTIAATQAEVLDIEEHMLHFLENHDEERIASSNFTGDATTGKPAMVVSALIGRSPTMIYFGQEVGEAGDLNDAMFNVPMKMRTTQYDYWGVSTHQRWMNDGAFDGGALSDDERALRDFYARLLTFSASSPALSGEYAAVESGNDRLFSFVRWSDDERLIVVSNFDDEQPYDFTLDVPADIISEWHLADGRYALDERLYGENNSNLVVDGGKGHFTATLEPLESVVLKVGGMQIVRHNNFPSRFVAPRPIDVWLPAGYRDADKLFRVLYAHDGQNLFNPEWSPYSKTDWAIDEVLQKLIDDGEVENTIVVGIGNTRRRFDEYLPWEMYEGGSSDYRSRINEYMVGDEPTSREYLQFIVEELKPFIDSHYRTRTGRDDTFLLGSSMGGLISLYGVTQYPEVFGGAACVSTSWPSIFTGDDPASNTVSVNFLHDVMPTPGKHKFYFDYGSAELDREFEPHQRVIDNLMRELGYEHGELWQTHEFEGAQHSEIYWRKRVHIPLKFLLGPAEDKE